jgi:hypothetical protein
MSNWNTEVDIAELRLKTARARASVAREIADAAEVALKLAKSALYKELEEQAVASDRLRDCFTNYNRRTK